MENNQLLMNELNVLQKLYDSNKLLEAENKTNELIKKFPKLPNLYNLLGLIYKKKVEIDNAIKAFEKAIEIQPNFAFAFNNLGDIYKQIEKSELAISNYKRAIELNPGLVEPYNNLGNLYSKINKFSESITFFQKAIKINPKLFIVHHNLGMAYKARGEFDKAKKSFLEAIKIKPDFFYSYRNIGLLEKWKKNDNKISELKKIFSSIKSDNENKRELAFTLGKAHADILNYEYAYRYFEEANRIQKENSSYSIDYDKKLFHQIESTFNKKLLNKTNYSQYSADNQITPIFIVGMPRSGTSLVEQILSNHSELFACGEIGFMNNLVNRYFLDKDKNFSLKKIYNHDQKSLNKIGNEYIENIKNISDGSFFITDKDPFNFRWVGIIKYHFSLTCGSLRSLMITLGSGGRSSQSSQSDQQSVESRNLA